MFIYSPLFFVNLNLIEIIFFSNISLLINITILLFIISIHKPDNIFAPSDYMLTLMNGHHKHKLLKFYNLIWKYRSFADDWSTSS